ncbi:MAG: 4-hydroxy-tetrahydrodipicolinate synthase [Holosporales bacterium]|jgi:4-hydroxy-tetrahydrodipicolinate synthase|nr:4-hydroxy-tetrahydrodipicolinate synthase [Holosporales bacterium]
MFYGYWAAAVTPFRHGRVDIASFERYIATLIEGGVQGLVVSGSTGEALALTREERAQLMKAATHQADTHIPVAAGIIAATTQEAVQQAQEAEKHRVTALLVVAPFYVKPSMEGLVAHFRAIHEATSLPIILYNNPTRTGMDIDFTLLERLTQLPRIVALKESSHHFARFSSWRTRLRKDFAFLAGDDDVAPAFLALGGQGVISVTANVAPKLCTAFYNAWVSADLETFARLRDRLAPLHKVLFVEPSPGPTKYALSTMGLIREEVRPPLLPLTDLGQMAVRRVLQDLRGE